MAENKNVSPLPLGALSPKASKFSSTQFDLEGAIRDRVLKFVYSIRDDDLANKGRETEPHITLKYGLHTSEPGEVAGVLQGAGPVKVWFRGVSIFKCDGYDVLKIDVRSDKLVALNKLISDALEHTDTHPAYVPHVTIAYLKPGRARNYISYGFFLFRFLGLSETFDTVSFLSKTREKTEISLTKAGVNYSLRDAFDKAIYSASSSKSGERWITINSAKPNPGGESSGGGTRIKIDSRGKILSGPSALKGRNLKSFGKPKAEPKTQSERTVNEAARRHGVARQSLSDAIDDHYRVARQGVEEREQIRRLARERIGMHAGDLARIENQYRDYSTIAKFDDVAGELASTYPEYFGGPGEDHSAKLWEFVRQGKERVLPKFSDEIIEAAAAALHALKASNRARRTAERRASKNPDEPGDVSFDFGANVAFSMMKNLTGNRAIDRAIYAMCRRPPSPQRSK